MFGRPPRTRNERAQAPKMTEEQLKIELQQQADLKRKEQRVQQLQDKEEILKQLEGQGQEVGQFKERIHQEYQDVLPQQIKAEQDRATRIRLREEERVRRQNGLGSAYEQQKEMLPVQLEHKLQQNLHKVHGDWLDQQPTLQNRVAQPSKVMQEFSYAPQGPHSQQQQKRNSLELYQEREYQQRDVYSREAPHQQQQQYQEPNQQHHHHHPQHQHQPQYRDNREYQNEFQQPPPPIQPNNYISRDNPSQAPIDPQKEKQRKYREELDNQINQRNQQQYQQPSSQQSRRSDIQNGPDFQDRFTSQQQQQRPPSSQQSGRSSHQQSQQMKYREELDKQIQEKKLREQQMKGNNNNINYNNNRPNTIDVFDYQNLQELECNDPTQSPGYNQPPPQSAPQGQSPPSGFNSRKITKPPTGIDDAEKQRQQQQYAEELRKQMEERQRKKKEQEEEEKRKEQLEVLKFEQQQKQIEQKHKEEQQKLQQQQQNQKQVLEHQIANKQLAKKFNKVNGDDVIKTSAIQILQTSPSQQQIGQDKQQSQRTEMTSQFQDYQHNPIKQQQISYVPQNKSHQLIDQQQQYQQYQPQQQYQPHNYPDQQQQLQLHSPMYQQPQHQQYFQHQTPLNNVEQMTQYQQVLFNDQSAHNQQNMQIHKQYLQQLQQNRYEIEMTRQILEEKLKLQQLEMQNQLLVDQYSRKIYDINKEQQSFESEIKKLQDYLRGKQKRPLNPEVFTSALYFSAMGNKDQLRQVQLHQEQQQQVQQVPHKIPIQQPEQQVLPLHPAKVRHHNPITESMIDNDIELPGQSEYVHVHVDHLGKSFIPELQKLKSQIIEKSQIKSDIKSIPISNIVQTSPSILESQFSHALPNVEQEYQWVEDEDEQMLDSQQIDNQQEQLIEFESIDQQEEINSFENLQEEDKEAYDEQEVIGRQTNYNLNMLKTQEYIAMFKENIQSQSKQQDLKFPAKLLHQNTIKLHHSSKLSLPDSNNQFQESHEDESFYESKDEDLMHRGSAGKEVQMSQAQFEMDYTSVVIPEEDEDSQIKPLKQSIQSNKKQQYQKPKTIDIFSRPQSKQDNSRQQSKQSIITSTNQSKMPHLQSHFPDQSRFTNLNPIQSETFIYPHKTELVKSRLDNLFQNCDQQNEILPKIDKASDYHQTVQTIYDIQQSGKMEENSQWKQQLDLFAYEQSDC